MRKKYYYLLLAVTIFGCESAEELVQESKSKNNPTQTYIINGDIEYISEITDGSKATKPKLIYDDPNEKIKNRTTFKTSDESVFIDFGYGIGGSTKSGCFINRYNDGNSYDTDNGVYGFNPAPWYGYMVRGYGQPHHNFYYGSLVFFVGNKGVKSQTKRGIWHDNQPHGSAISIEYPFKANVSYEIQLNVSFHDNIYLVDKIHSSGYPSVFVQLKDDGVISARSYRTQTQDPCDREGVITLDEYSNDYQNYTRSYTLDSPAIIGRNLVFKFSTTKEKKALLISLHPSLSEPGYEAPIQKNNYTMRMPSVSIIEKPFDQSLYTAPSSIPDNGNINEGDGNRR